MALADMIDLDEDALICDFAEVYHIYNYRSLPARLVATYAVGLRDTSRIKQKQCGQTTNDTNYLLTVLIDRVGALITGFGNGDPLPSYSDMCFTETREKTHTDDLQRFEGIEAFEAARHKILGGTSDG